MPVGPGVYDDLCTDVRLKVKAGAVLLIVIDGERGSGFSCQADVATTMALPTILRRIAADIDRDGPVDAGKPKS